MPEQPMDPNRPAGAADRAEIMPAEEHRRTLRTHQEHWWYAGRREVIRTLLASYRSGSAPRDIADTGCGVGVNLDLLLTFGKVAAFDNDDFVLDFVRNHWNKLEAGKWTYPQDLPRRFNLIVMTDVLEHLPDDAGIGDWLDRQLADGGQALLTVPALQILWSEMDEVVGHFRRYNRTRLRKLFSAKFDLVRISYYNFFMVPVKIGFVLFSRLKKWLRPTSIKKTYNDTPPSALNRLFFIILSLEAALLRWISFPCGAGLVVLLRKKSPATGQR